MNSIVETLFRIVGEADLDSTIPPSATQDSWWQQYSLYILTWVFFTDIRVRAQYNPANKYLDFKKLLIGWNYHIIITIALLIIKITFLAWEML